MGPRPLTLYGKPLKYKQTVKILGIQFNSSLNWTENALERVKSCTKKLMTIHKKQGKMWGLQPKMALWVYTGIVRPSLTHGCMVWVGATYKAKVRAKFRTLQLLAMRMMGCWRKGTPGRGLDLITYTPPIHLHVRRLAAQSHIRTRHRSIFKDTPLHSLLPTFKGHRQICEDLVVQFGVPTSNITLDTIPR